MKKIIAAFFLGGIIALAFSCGGGDSSPKADTVSAKSDTAVSGSPATADGKTLYNSKCTVCHGEDGKKGVMGAADLSGSTVNEEGAALIIKNGKNAMTAFGGQLSDEEISAVVKYVLTLRK